MKVRYIGPDVVTFDKSKEYEVITIEKGWYRIMSELDESYLLPPKAVGLINDSPQPMTPKYTETEMAALCEKERSPKIIVVCPRCGKELSYREIENSYEIKCPTQDCLKATFRGI